MFAVLLVAFLIITAPRFGSAASRIADILCIGIVAPVVTPVLWACIAVVVIRAIIASVLTARVAVIVIASAKILLPSATAIVTWKFIALKILVAVFNVWGIAEF
jgi:hypothetical protein